MRVVRGWGARAANIHSVHEQIGKVAKREKEEKGKSTASPMTSLMSSSAADVTEVALASNAAAAADDDWPLGCCGRVRAGGGVEPGDSSPRRAAVELLGDGDADSAMDISRESAAGEANDDAAGLRVLFAEESMGDAVECSSDMAAAGEYMCAEGGDLTMANA